MKVENIKDYEVRVVKSTKVDGKGTLLNPDPTKARPIEDDKDGHYSKDRAFYQLSLLAPKFNGKRAQTGIIPLNVFNSNDQIVLFNDITDAIALGEGIGYSVAANGDLLLFPAALKIGGCVIEEKCGFVYRVMTRDTTGKLVQMDSWKKNDKGVPIKTPSTKSTVKVFVHEDEDEDVRIAIEIDRVRVHKLDPIVPVANSDSKDIEVE